MSLTSRNPLIALALALVLLAAACGGGSKNSSGGENTGATEVSATTVAASAPVAASATADSSSGDLSGTPAAKADPNSPDCLYNAKLFDAYSGMLSAIFGLAFAPDSAATPVNGQSVLTDAQKKKAIDAFVSGADTAAAKLPGITPPPDFKQFHADLVAGIRPYDQHLKSIQQSANTGNTKPLDDFIANLLADGGPKGDAADPFTTVGPKYPALGARLDACPTPLD